MSNLNNIFVESKTVTFDVDVTKKSKISSEKTRRVERTIVKGTVNGKPVVGGVLKFGPLFESQTSKQKIQNTP